MIFQTAFLASLLGTSYALTPATTSTTATHEAKVAEIKKQVKSNLHEKLAMPSSMKGKIEKFSKRQVKESTIDLATTKFDEPATNLRGLKMKDNFLSFMAYMDDQCMQPMYNFGNLVNYCFNEVGEETGAKRSYLTKVNLKENLAVEIQYEGFDCQVRFHVSCFYFILFLIAGNSLQS